MKQCFGQGAVLNTGINIYCKMMKWVKLLFLLQFCVGLSLHGQIFYNDGFGNPAIWSLNGNPASMVPAQGTNDPSFNPWVINGLNFFTPTGPIAGNSLKITIQPGTDFDGLGLSANYTGFDPFNVNERNITDGVALMNTNIDVTGRFGITLEFDYQSGGWLGDDYGTALYSIDGGVNWTELDNSFTVTYTTIDANNNPVGFGGSDPAAPPNVNTRNAFSNIDGFSSGVFWHRASVLLPATCDNISNLRLGFRWRNIDHLTNSPDYVGVSFNVDNIALRIDPPTADFSWTPTSICINQNVTFDPSASTPGGGASVTGWIWTFSGGSPASSSLQNPVVSWPSAGMDTVTLHVINNLGDTSLVASQYIFINECTPTADFNSASSVCQDSILTFSDLSSNMTPAFGVRNWNWTFAGGTPASASGQGPHNVSFSSTGPTSVTLSISNDYGTDDTTMIVNVVDCSCGALAVGGLIWSEDFDGNSGAGSRWLTSTLNQPIGVQGTSANLWYISDTENGNTPPACGSANGGNLTLHLGAQFADFGAAYEIGCSAGCLFCDNYLICILSSTDKRSQSQNIVTTGQSNLTLDFDYIESGEGATDNAYVEYSTDGGASWNFLADPAKSPTTCLPQGTWTAFSVALPAACENIANLRIAFRWQNDDNAVGSDPSFAVNDIRISAVGGSPPFIWIGGISNDWNVAANWSTGTVPTASDNVLVPDPSSLISLCPFCVMPNILTADAVANDVCNYGTITIHDSPLKRTLTVFGALLNEGAITTTSADTIPDVLMRGAASTYAGTGTNIDTDYQIQSGQTTLLTDISCRSLKISANFDWSIFTITVKRGFYQTTGSVTSTTSSTLVMDGPGTGFDTNPSQYLGSNITLTIPNWIVNKASGIVTLSTAAIHSISQRMTIIRGIVDQQTNRITGAGDLVMLDGEFRISRLTTTFPSLTGPYYLSGGLVQLYGAGDQNLRGSRRYFELEFTGSGVKTLGGNADVQEHLYLNETFGLGNYVDANGNTLHVLNPDPSSVTYTGGHVVGDLQRNILPNGTYSFDVGSDNAGTVTFYEPIDIQPVNLAGTSDITVAFNKNAPNPLTVVPPLVEFGAAFTTMETEGYWEVNPNAQPSGGTFTVTEFPSPAWVFSNVSYTQVRQDGVGLQWTWNSSVRITALKRRNYPSFSNFGIASSSDALPVLGMSLAGTAEKERIRLDWSTEQEFNTAFFEVQRSTDGQAFYPIGELAAGGDLPDGAEYQHYDLNPMIGMNYYRLRQVDQNGSYSYSNTVHIPFGGDLGLLIYPNPATAEIHLEYDGRESLRLTLTNLLGQQLWSKQVEGDEVLDVSALPRGVYLLTVRNAEGRSFSKKLQLK